MFDFLNYVRPFWYINLKPVCGKAPYWIDYRKLTPEEKLLINLDAGYSSFEISLMDAAFQARQKGIICTEEEKLLGNEIISLCPTIEDNYRIIKRFFKPFWHHFILFLRLVTLHNPLTEIKGWLKSFKIRRVPTHHPFNQHQDYQNYHLDLTDLPKVTVIIPTLNRYSYLKNALEDLRTQTIAPHEIIIIDQSDQFENEFYEAFKALPLRLIFQKEKGQWRARNKAIKISSGDLILLFDDDSRVNPNWIYEHLKALKFFKADISAGISTSEEHLEISENYNFFLWSDRLDSGNTMIRRKVFEQAGLFDLQFDGQRMGDGEFGLRVFLKGFKIISHPYASRVHLLASTGGLRDHGSWSAMKPIHYIAPRPVPSVIYFLKRYFPAKNLWAHLLINVPLSYSKEKEHPHHKGNLLELLFLVLNLPIVLYNLSKSFKIASKMLQKGPRIEFL